MSEGTAFPDFIRRIRAGDDQAARELLERYEPVIRCEVRLRLRDPRLYSRFDWTDICQSVMASFFVRAAAGQFDLEQPDQLLRLLVVMTRHKLTQHVRRHSAGRREYRRLEARQLADLRGQGCGWAEIATRLGGTADACRKQLARAIDRVEHQLEGSEIG